jgi:hypothetical protein
MSSEKSDQERMIFDEAMRGLVKVPMREVIAEEKEFQRRKAQRNKKK